VLFVALFAAASVAVLATCLLQLSGSSQRRQLASVDLRRAFYLADAGLAEAYSGVTIGKSGDIGSAAQPAKLGNGVLWVDATDIDDDHVRVESIGMCGRARATLEMTLERGESSVATLGMFAHQPLTVPAGSTIKGYDSSAPAAASPGGGGGLLGGLLGGLGGGGAAPSTPPTVPGRMGSNGKITLNGTAAQPTTVSADLAPGVGQSVVVGRHVTHTGATTPRVASAPLPEVELPFEPTATGVTHTGLTPYVVQSGDVGLQFLSVASGARAIVQGPCHLVVDDLTVASGGTLEFDTDDGAVAVWVGDKLDFVDGSAVVCAGTDPSLVTIQVASDTPAHYGASGKLYAVLYAPQAEASLGSQAQVLGALVADELVLASGAKLTFDAHLDEVSSTTVLPTLLSWRILELESAVSHGEGNDPFQILGVDPTALLSPALSHADLALHVVYKNLLGTTMTYDGLESGFDWTKVSEVTQVERAGKPVGYRATAVQALAAQALATVSATAAALAITPPLTSAELKRRLVYESPLPDADLVKAVSAGRLSAADLKIVLQANTPLTSPVLNALDTAGTLSSSDMRTLLIASSPLPVDVLAKVLADALSLSVLDKLAVIAAQ
jgi:hypothetical protein